MVPVRPVAQTSTTEQVRDSVEVLSYLAAPRRRARFWIAIWTAAVAVQLVALRPVVFPPEPLSAFLVMYHVVGLPFTTCGLVAWRRRPDSRVGQLMTTAGFLLYAWPVISQIPTAEAQVLASMLEELWPIPMVALLLAYRSAGRLTARTDRLLLAPFVLVVILETIPWLFLEREGNFLLVRSAETTGEVIQDVARVLAALACAAVALAIGRRWRTATRPQRRAMLPSVAGIVSLLLFATINAMNDPPEALLWAAVTSLIIVPAAFLAGLLRSRLARAGLAQLIRDLETKRGPELEAALALALGDPGMRLLFLSAESVWVDSSGRPTELPIDDRTSVVPIEPHGAPVAALVHDASLDDDPDLVAAVRSAATIAFENGRVERETRARLAELRESRTRIVAAADAERRRIERNLHDGAQQRLVGLSMQLASIRRQIRDDPRGAEVLAASAADEVTLSLQELRELARGINPSALDQGLIPALESLANRSTVPTSVAGNAMSLPPGVAMAAYFIASEALTNIAKHSGATCATITVAVSPEELVLTITDDGVGGADERDGSGLRGVVDRVETLDGSLEVLSPPGAGTTLTARMSCSEATP